MWKFFVYLYSQRYSLELSLHLIEFLDMASCPNEILGHDFASGHLSRFRRLFDIIYQFLLLLFKLRSLTIQLTLRLIE